VITTVVKNYFNSSLPDIGYEVFDSIKNIPTEEWNKIAGEKIFLQHQYLIALENSKPAGFSFYYVFILEKKTVKGICYFQIVDLVSKELGSIINPDTYGSFLSNVGNKINRLLFSGSKYTSANLIVCGSLFVSGEYGISADSEKYFPVVLKTLPEIIEKITLRIKEQKGKVIAWVVKDFYEIPDKNAQSLLKENFHRMVIDPNMIFHVRKEWRSFDDYINALSAKYRLRANNVMKKLEDVKIVNLEIAEIEKEKETIEKLYLQVQKKAPVRIVRVEIRYFLELKTQLKDDFVFRAFYLDKKMIAFTSGFKHKTRCEAHFIGIDYHYNKSHSLYQNILYDFILEAITNKCEELVFGRTAMEIKSTVGAVAHPLYSYIKFSNSLLNRAARHLVPSVENKSWIPRNPFKEE
jgi:predicted N-acyltransferase